MNKFEEMIKRNGIILGQGISRAAYLFKNKVFKISRDNLMDEDNIYRKQTDNEQYIYKVLINQNPEFADFFPNPQWHGRVCEADRCTTVEELCEAEGIEADWVIDALNELGYPAEEVQSFFSFLKRMDKDFDVVDLGYNLSNTGITNNGDLVILDWGL